MEPDAPLPKLAALPWQLDADVPDFSSEPPPEPIESLARPATVQPSTAAEDPPTVRQIHEAMLFTGGSPLTFELASAAIRGLSEADFRNAIDELARACLRQKRPYAVVPQGDGYSFAIAPKYRRLQERLTGGPREARLTQPAIEVLSAIAYRQPIAKREIDELRGDDATAALRQLVRLGLVAGNRGGAETRYATTDKFLELFRLESLDDLPRLAEAR